MKKSDGQQIRSALLLNRQIKLIRRFFSAITSLTGMRDR